MTLYSILYDSFPFDDIPNQFKVMLAISKGERPELLDSSEEFELFNNLIQRCWHPNPNLRPNFDEILNILLQNKDILIQSNQIEEKKVNDFLEFCNTKKHE